MSASKKLDANDLLGAKIVGYSYTEDLQSVQIELKNGEQLRIQPKGQTPRDRRLKIEAWLEVVECHYDNPKRRL